MTLTPWGMGTFKAHTQDGVFCVGSVYRYSSHCPDNYCPSFFFLNILLKIWHKEYIEITF